MQKPNLSEQISLVLMGLLFLSCSSFAQDQIPAHDPVMIRENGIWYLFCTGQGIAVWSSADRKNWSREEPVFRKPPGWAEKAVPGFKGHIWAPDISFFNGKYYLYYSVSSFGKNTSCIGLATNRTLDPNDPDFGWIDHGKVIQSFPGRTNWNAIDPNLIVDEQGQPYLAFGSFWDGLKLVRLSADAMSVEGDTIHLPTIASRKVDPHAPNPPAVDDNPGDAGGNAIEAPFIFKRDGYYYLFASIDYCCKGVNSTYKMIVGRARQLTGPYLDKDGRPMATGGGSLVLSGNSAWHGVGHNAVVSANGKDFLIFHGYDASDDGHAKLLIREIGWDRDGWPVLNL